MATFAHRCCCDNASFVRNQSLGETSDFINEKAGQSWFCPAFCPFYMVSMDL